jgi:hypothetical protein
MPTFLTDVGSLAKQYDIYGASAVKAKDLEDQRIYSDRIRCAGTVTFASVGRRATGGTHNPLYELLKTEILRFSKLRSAMSRAELLAKVEPELRRRERNVRAAIAREAGEAGEAGAAAAGADGAAGAVFDIFDMPRPRKKAKLAPVIFRTFFVKK